MKKGVYIVLVLLLLSSILASAHEEETQDSSSKESLTTLSLIFIGIAFVNAITLIIIASLCEKKVRPKKIFFFLGIIIPIALSSIFLVGETIYTNTLSESDGPVHWHADYEMWACGEKLDLINPQGLSNREGTSSFHEHNDNRIHAEGVIEDMSGIDLQSFIEVVGGSLEQTSMSILTNDGLRSYTNGNQCNGTVQVFVYKTVEEKIVQEKIIDFQNYILSPYTQVPPGDCIIIDFDTEKERTEHICETYKIAINGENNGS